MAAFNKFDCFVADMANKVHNLGSDTLKVMLTNGAPVVTNTVIANITEIAAGNGYTAGGIALTGVTSTQTSGVEKLYAANDPKWTASGTIGPFRYAVLYNSTATDGPLIGWWDYGSNVTLTNSGETYTVDLNQTDGVLTVQ